MIHKLIQAPIFCNILLHSVFLDIYISLQYGIKGCDQANLKW